MERPEDDRRRRPISCRVDQVWTLSAVPSFRMEELCGADMDGV